MVSINWPLLSEGSIKSREPGPWRRSGPGTLGLGPLLLSPSCGAAQDCSHGALHPTGTEVSLNGPS